MSAFLLLTLAIASADPNEKNEDKPASFTCDEGNYRVHHTAEWRRIPSSSADIQLMLGNKNMVLLASGLESKLTSEELLALMRTDFLASWDSIRVVSTKEATVQNIKAVWVRMEGKFTGLMMQVVVTAFSHQGIVYRLAGISTAREKDALEDEYDEFIKSFQFLKERKEWLARHVGKPHRTAIAGGTISLELNRPRWQENLDSANRDYQQIDSLHFEFIQGGAWLDVKVRRAKRPLPAERARQAEDLESRLLQAKLKEKSLTVGKESFPTIEVAGSHAEFERLFRGAIVQRDDLIVELVMEALEGRREDTQRDWEQLLGSLRFRAPSRENSLPLFRLEPNRELDLPTDPNLAVFLSKATRINVDQPFAVLAFSPDGSKVLRREAQSIATENLGTHRLDNWNQIVPYSPHSDWSKDGKRAAFSTGHELVIASPFTARLRTLAIPAVQAVFTAAKDELLVVVALGHSEELYRPQEYTRLERINSRTEERKVVLEFPLGRISLPTPSPDGQRLALVSNRDYPRRTMIGGHLYVCDRDGKNLKQLTRDPEEITSIAWAPDAKTLYVVRRIKDGENGAVGLGGSMDLYRIDPTTGAAVNLTRSNHVTRVWCVGNDLILQTQNWMTAEAQRGFFRIAPTVLEKATSGRPLPATKSSKVIRREMAKAIQGRFGAQSIDELTLRPELIDPLAKAFVEAAAEVSGIRFDYTAASLAAFDGLIAELNPAADGERGLIFAAGAYYGETLRKVYAAEWKIRPAPIGRWLPGKRLPFMNLDPFTNAVLPFTEAFRSGFSRDEDDRDGNSLDLLRRDGRKIVLVFPPSAVDEVIESLNPESYRQAQKLLDSGAVANALDLLIAELRRNPKNAELARKVFQVSQGLLDAEKSRAIIRQAVEDGCESPDFLLAHADALAAVDPNKALVFYRRAIQSDWPSGQALFKIGKLYQKLNQPDLAECCFRKAYPNSPENLRTQIRPVFNKEEKIEN